MSPEFEEAAGPPGQRRPALRLLGVVPLALLVSACLSYSYTDANNRRHVVGLVSVVIEPADGEGAGRAPAALSVTSLGVHFYANPQVGSGLVVGYGRETTLQVPNNSCLDLERPGPCAERAAAAQSSETSRSDR